GRAHHRVPARRTLRARRIRLQQPLSWRGIPLDMKQIVISRHGGPEVLRVVEGSDPIPGRGELRIRVRATGVNFADVMARIGLYPDAPPPPCVVGYEVAGVVDAVG